jgi:hypothetical protein
MTPAAGESSDGATHWSTAEESAIRHLSVLACGVDP